MPSVAMPSVAMMKLSICLAGPLLPAPVVEEFRSGSIHSASVSTLPPLSAVVLSAVGPRSLMWLSIPSMSMDLVPSMSTDLAAAHSVAVCSVVPLEVDDQVVLWASLYHPSAMWTCCLSTVGRRPRRTLRLSVSHQSS